MTDELAFALELSQTLKAYVSWQAMVFLSHVTHKEFVTGKLFAATLAFHLLRLLEKIQVGENELQL